MATAAQLNSVPIRTWQASMPEDLLESALKSLESGDILYFPELAFSLCEDEKQLLHPNLCHSARKNISYDLLKNQLSKISGAKTVRPILVKMMQRYAADTAAFMQQLFPYYQDALKIGRTSFRPVEIKDRVNLSFRKDDKRLHVDAFPSTPMRERRIIRFFTNINPNNEARLWRIGEPFSEVIKKFMPYIAPPVRGSATLLHRFKITRGKRSLYDHYMLRLHNAMKRDEVYQTAATQQSIAFPAGSSWIVYTDLVSHAAMAGQYVLEQTFYLDWSQMKYQGLAPVSILEQFFKRHLL